MNDKIIKLSSKEQKALEKQQKIILQVLKDENLLLLQVGSIIIKENGDLSKVLAIKPFRDFKWKKDKKEFFWTVKVTLQDIDIDGNPDTYIVWDGNTPIEEVKASYDEKISELRYYHKDCILQISPKDLRKEVLATILTDEPESEKPELSTSTDLAIRMDKDYLETISNSLEKRKNYLEAKSRMLKHLLDAKRYELAEIMEGLLKQVKKIKRVIGTIELYLGINEDITQIQEGTSADINIPIFLRQQILYMDEEVGDPRGGGWDFKNIEDFENWLVADKKHYEKLVPEQKCVIVMRIRRDDKKYTDDRFMNAVLNEANYNTFFLIRNGDNLYTIWADLVIGKRLFPLRDEIQKIFDKMINKHMFESEKEQIEDHIFYYRRNFIVLQGLIERTDIFKPYNIQDFNILKPDSYGDYVQFIYDDEVTLPSGRFLYKEWKKNLNKEIKRGSRIYVGRGAPGGKDAHNRFLIYLNEFNLYNAPPIGLYTVEEGAASESEEIHRYYKEGKKGKKIFVKLSSEEEEDWWRGHYEGNAKLQQGLIASGTGEYKRLMKKYWFIKYKPKEEARSGWNDWEGHNRKNKVSYRIYEDDSFIFNYDALPFDDIDFYLESRVDRPNYLRMIPTLRDLKRLRLEEMEWEEHFTELIKNEIKKQLNLDSKYDADILISVWEAITWWKHKNIWQRPIAKDDTKALRMIRGRVLMAFRYNR